MHITFDTLEMVRRLEAKGFKREQAEEVISVVKDVQNELATKLDVENSTKDLKSEIASVRSEISSVRTELKAEIASVRTELKAEISSVRSEMKSDIENLRKEIKNLELRITIKFGVMLFAMLFAFKVLDKFL